jgi:cold shock CspA family protein
MNKMIGTIVFYDPDRGFGFIEAEDKSHSKVYLHATKVISGTPVVGSKAKFELALNDRQKHKFAAASVEVL